LRDFDNSYSSLEWTIDPFRSAIVTGMSAVCLF
jgi:hypothetical protein